VFERFGVAKLSIVVDLSLRDLCNADLGMWGRSNQLAF